MIIKHLIVDSLITLVFWDFLLTSRILAQRLIIISPKHQIPFISSRIWGMGITYSHDWNKLICSYINLFDSEPHLHSILHCIQYSIFRCWSTLPELHDRFGVSRRNTKTDKLLQVPPSSSIITSEDLCVTSPIILPPPRLSLPRKSIGRSTRI